MAAAAPEIPAVGVGAFTIGVAVIFVFAWALDVFYRNVISPVVKRIAAIGFGGVRGHLGAHPFGFLTHVDDTVLRWLHNAKASTESITVRSFHVFVNFQVAVAHNVAQTTVDAYNALHRLQFYWTPYFIGVKLRPIQHAIGSQSKVDADLRSHSHPKTKGAVKNITYKITKVQKNYYTQAHAAGGTATIKPAEWTKVKAELNKLKWAVPFAGMLTFGLALLKRLGIGWVRCPRVGKVGKFLCNGIDGNLLEALLLDAAAVAVAFNIEDFVKELQTVTEDGVKLIQKFAE